MAGGSTVLEVGPDTVRVLAGGTGLPAPRDLVAAALHWIDDPVGLLDESPVAVAELWHAVMAAAVGRHCDSVVVVHPQDWPVPRVGRVLAAANAFADRVHAVSRTDWTPDHAGSDPGTEPPDDHTVRRRPERLGWSLPVAVAAVAAVAGVGLVAAVALPRAGPEPAEGRVAQGRVTEGRVEVRVPPDWTIERITAGPGSRRVQVSSPSEPDVALHITQSYAPDTTLTEAAEVLERAIAGQPAGVFIDFRGDDAVAGRPAVTYRELRPGRVIRWAVLPAGATRISIGCQSPPEREAAVRGACEQAVRSAREWGAETGR